MKRVSIVYHYFAHYREPVLNAIIAKFANSDGMVELLADTDCNLPNLELVDLDGLKSSGCSVTRLKNMWFGNWLWQSGLLRALQKSRSNSWIFLGQFSFLSTWLALLLARLLGKKTYLWTHGLYGNEGRLKLLLRLSFYRMADGLLLYGNYSKELLTEHGYPASRLHVIYNSLDYDTQVRLRSKLIGSSAEELRSELFGPDERDVPYLIYVGRLTAVKDLDVLLLALARLNALGGAQCNCLIVGDGPEREKLQKLAQSEGVANRVRFYGAEHSEKKLCRLFYHASVCVSPGNVGLTAMHALAYGVPVVTHDDPRWQMPEFEAIVPEQTGGFYARGEIDSLVTMISTWTANRLSREEVREACYRVIDEKYNPSFQAALIESLAP